MVAPYGGAINAAGKSERLFAWLFNFRRLVVRWEYHAENFQGWSIWLRQLYSCGIYEMASESFHSIGMRFYTLPSLSSWRKDERRRIKLVVTLNGIEAGITPFEGIPHEQDLTKKDVIVEIQDFFKRVADNYKRTINQPKLGETSFPLLIPESANNISAKSEIVPSAVNSAILQGNSNAVSVNNNSPLQFKPSRGAWYLSDRLEALRREQ